MSIMEAALEKAKRIGSGKPPDSLAAGRTDGGSAPRRQRLEVAHAPKPTLEFAAVDIDVALCEKNRVLIGAVSGRDYSTVLDSYRILRTRLRRRLGSDDMVSVGIVSVGAGEGKSLTSVNLALALARENKQNVFLLDLDLRSPTICNKLGVVPRAEIGDHLSNGASAAEAFFTIGVDNLAIAGGVGSHENSSELLGSGALLNLFEYIRNLDPRALILVDLPPLLLSADALVVAPHLTTTLLVVSEGVTRREHLRRATEVLAGVNVAGVVLNRSGEAAKDYYG
jgi:protein-tyrosine kinase